MNITFEGEGSFFTIYRIVLEEAINYVSKKLSLTIPPEIEWIIFEPNRNLPQVSSIEQSLSRAIIKNLPLKGHEYGHCIVKEKKIWISTVAIQSYNVATVQRMKLPGIKQSNCLLANVIMDELAHIITGKDHGDPIYDRELMSYRSRYYS